MPQSNSVAVTSNGGARKKDGEYVDALKREIAVLRAELQQLNGKSRSGSERIVGAGAIRVDGDLLPKHTWRSWRSDTRYLYPAPVEIVNLTKDPENPDAPEEAEFAQRIAEEAIRGWNRFRFKVLPELEKERVTRKSRTPHELVRQARNSLNDAFYQYQRALFEVLLHILAY